MAKPRPTSSTKTTDRKSAKPIDSTAELIVRAKVGDRLAESEIIRRSLPRLRRFAHGRLPRAARSRFDTEDLVQDSMLHTLQRLPSFDPTKPGGLQAYLQMAIKNRIRDEYRRLGRSGAEVELVEVVDPGPSPFEEAKEKEIGERQRAAMERLRPAERALLVARIDLGYDYAHIARLFGKPTANAARVAVGRALRRALDAAMQLESESPKK